MRYRRAQVAVLWMGAIVLCFLGGCDANEVSRQQSALADRSRLSDLVNGQQHVPLDEYQLFRAPSYPRNIDKLLPEWEICDSLVVSLPYNQVFSQEALSSFFVQLVEAAARHVHVLVLYDESHLGTVQTLLDSIQKDPDSVNVLKNVELTPARINTVWARDYGPVFGVNHRGDICVLDAIYRDIPTEAILKNRDRNQSGLDEGTSTDKQRSTKSTADRNEDDVAPVYLTQYLYTKYGSRVKHVRSPIQLWGGDFTSDSDGNVFTSTNTLLMNGGSRDDVDLILKLYYGAKHITYLLPLPGQTIKHLDMFFRVIDKETLLLAEYDDEPRNGESIYESYLNHEIKRVLDYDLALLRSEFPKKRIVRMPMPRVELAVSDELQRLLGNAAVQEYVEKRLPKSDSSDAADKSDPEADDTPTTQPRNAADGDDDNVPEASRKRATDSSSTAETTSTPITRQRYETLKDALGDDAAARLAAKLLYAKEHDMEAVNVTEEQLMQAVAPDLKDRLQGLTAEEPDLTSCIYRTYINCTYLKASPTDQILLVPSYSLESADGDRKPLSATEVQVRKIYEALYPGVEVIFINSDEVIKEYGAVHCVTCVIPKF